MKQLISFCIIFQALGLIYADFESVATLNHPDQNNYQSSVAGTDKHKYGYELKENKHFHHTTTEKDGVRLGCYGYELEGKQYSTQYVADSHGYRLVNNQDLITVYPKSGGTREASFFNDFQENKALSSNIRYFFPVGCKGIDTLIDNSSRLRTMGIPVPDARPYFPTPKPDVKPRLPVTLKPSTSNGYVYNTPPNSYIPPGPSHIYAPELVPVTTKKPPSVYLPPKETTTPAKPTNIYLPPVTPTSLYLPPVTTKRTTTYKPTPPHTTPTSHYLPPVTTKRTTTYRPPPPHPTKPRPVISQEISPPAVPQHCESSTSCCEEASAGSFVIPIPLANGNGSGCCKLVAKLILPINGFDDDSIKKLRSSVSQEIDATQIIKKVLRNLL